MRWKKKSLTFLIDVSLTIPRYFHKIANNKFQMKFQTWKSKVIINTVDWHFS